MKKYVVGGMLLLLFVPAHALAQSTSPELKTEIQEGLESLKKGDFAAAEKHLSAALKIDPSLAEVRANLGLAYYADRQYSKAAAEFKQALERDPSLRTAKSFLPLSLAAMGNCREAVPGLQQEFDSNPDVNLRRVLGLSLEKCFLAAGKESDADGAVQKLLKEYPNDPDVLYAAGQVYGRLSSESYLKLMRVAPNSPRSYQVMGSAAAADGNWKGAIEAYRQALKLEPTMQGSHLQIAILLLTHSSDPNAWHQALSELNEELKIDPTNAEAHYEIGEVYRKHDQLELAVGAFHQALQLDANGIPARLGLAKALRALGRKQEALEALEPARNTAPGDPDVHFVLAQIYRDMGRAAEAEKETTAFQRLRKTPRVLSADPEH